MKRMLTFACAAVAAALAACQTTEDAREQDQLARAAIAAKQGEQVNRICFASSINSWREFGSDAVLLRKGANDWYKLDLSGACDPEGAFNSIAVITRPAGGCVSRGDEIGTFDQTIGGACLITEIHEWNEDARMALER